MSDNKETVFPGQIGFWRRLALRFVRPSLVWDASEGLTLTYKTMGGVTYIQSITTSHREQP